MDKEEEINTRQQKRAKRLNKKKAKMPQHGKSLSKMYRDTILKEKGKRD